MSGTRCPAIISFAELFLRPRCPVELNACAEKAELNLTDDKKEQLVTITAFNINARYDGCKMSFKKNVGLNSPKSGLIN